MLPRFVVFSSALLFALHIFNHLNTSLNWPSVP